ncbi:hypothetical protein KC343_g1253 [Hortaea werneckii]|nr:hypothetical protein KC343_g1253 [Hortaea werneckii]
MSININVTLPLDVVAAMQNVPDQLSGDEAKAAISPAMAQAMLAAVKTLPFSVAAKSAVDEKKAEHVEDSISVWLRGFCGEISRILINPAATVHDLKNKIQTQHGIPYDDYGLLFNENYLDDFVTLKELGANRQSFRNMNFFSSADCSELDELDGETASPWQDILNNAASHKAEQSIKQPITAKMADWNLTVPINLPLNTITAIQNGEGIEAVLSELSDSELEGHAIVRDVARAVIDTVNGSAYRITSNSETTMPPATYTHSTSRPARGYEAYDSLSMSKASVCSERIPSQEGIIEEDGWMPPGKINILISNTINKKLYCFPIGHDATVGSLFDLFMDAESVSGSPSGLRVGSNVDKECLDLSDTIKQAGLRHCDVLTAVEYPEDRVVVTFKDAMLRTQTAESNVLALVETLLSSYVDETDYDIESLIFVLNGEWEFREADYALTLRDCGIKNGDLIAVRPRGEEPKYINIIVQDPLGHQYGLKIREDAQTSTLRSQYEIQIGPAPPGLRFRFEGLSLKDGLELRRIGIGEGSSVQVNLAFPVPEPESATLIGKGSCVQVNRALPVPEPGFAAPSFPPTSPDPFAPNRLLSRSYVPTASYSGWGYTPCPAGKTDPGG